MYTSNDKLMEVDCCLHDVMCFRQIIMKRYYFFPLFPSFSPCLLLHPIIYFCTAWIPSQIPGLYVWLLFSSHNSSSHLLTEKHFIIFNQFPPQAGLLLKWKPNKRGKKKKAMCPRRFCGWLRLNLKELGCSCSCRINLWTGLVAQDFF